jgi:hypothetical protein
MVAPTHSSKQPTATPPAGFHPKRNRTDEQDLLQNEEPTPKRKCDTSEKSPLIPTVKKSMPADITAAGSLATSTSPCTTASLIDWYRKAPNCIDDWKPEDYQ